MSLARAGIALVQAAVECDASATSDLWEGAGQPIGRRA